MMRRDESGMTIMELAVTSFVLMIAMTAIFQIFQSLVHNDSFQHAKISNQEEVRAALKQIAKDVREANPILGQPLVTDYETQFELAIGPASGPQEYIRWRLDGTVLYREVLVVPGGTASSSRKYVRNVHNPVDGTQLFRYFDDSQQELPTSGATAVTAGDIENCTIRVRVTISADPEPGPLPFTEQIDAEMRNRLPGGLGC